MAARRVSDLEARVRDQLVGWGLDGTAEAAAVLDIARRLARRDLRPAAAAMLHGQLRTQLVDLRKLAPPEEGMGDAVDELKARRDDRRRQAAGE